MQRRPARPPRNWLGSRRSEGRSPGEKNGWLLGTGFGDTPDVRAEVEYSAVSVKVDLESGEVASVDIRAPGDGDESRSEVRVSVESQTDEAEEVFDHAQQLVDAAAPFKLRGWWAPAPTQRWAPLDDSGKTARAEEDPQLKLRRPPAKEVGKPPPYAVAYADVLPESHREALRHAAITYLDEWFSAIVDGQPGQSYSDTPRRLTGILV
jgi:hypothetical protein